VDDEKVSTWKKVVVACWKAISRHCPEETKKIHSLLASTLDGGEWLTSRPGRSPPGNNLGTLGKRGCLDPRAGMKGL